MESTYCRLCAELKPLKKMLQLQTDDKKYEEICYKLHFLQAAFVNMSDDTFPKAVCIVCYDSLNQAYKFLEMIQKAQCVLTEKFGKSRTRINSDLSSRGEMKDSLLTKIHFDVSLKEEPKDSFMPGLSFDVSLKEETKDSLKTMITYDVPLKEEPKDSSMTGINSDVGLREETEDSCDSYIFNSEGSVQIEDSSEFTSSSKGYEKKKVSLEILPVRNDLHWTNIPWLCYFCDSQFGTLEDLRTHAKTMHNTCGAFKCPHCDIKIHKNYIKIFINHMKKHIKCLRQWCHYCNESFPTFSKLASHIPEHFEGRSLCLYCGETFDDESSLKEHLVKYSARQDNPKPPRKRGEPEDISKRTCKICHKIVSKSSGIPSHMQHVHSDRKSNYPCEVCGKVFYWKETVIAHVKTVHEKLRSFECKICHKTFAQLSHLNKHVKAIHLDEKLYECEVCGKKCRDKYRLDEHRLIHTDHMPFNCHICHKAFRLKSQVKSHLKQHTGEKPHSCEFCGKTFACSGNRNKHLLRMHKKETPKRTKPDCRRSSTEL